MTVPGQTADPVPGQVKNVPPSGFHVIAELSGCPYGQLNDQASLVQALRDCALAAGAKVLGVQSHQFSPQGVTAIALLAESHISIHSWPEHGYAAVDVFTCGPAMKPEAAVSYLQTALSASEVKVTVVPRGMNA